MNKKDLVKLLAKKCDLTLARANVVLSSLVDIIVDGLYCGESITIPGLGNFSAKYQKAGFVRLPNTDARVLVPARFLPKFRCSKALKQKFVVDFG